MVYEKEMYETGVLSSAANGTIPVPFISEIDGGGDADLMLEVKALLQSVTLVLVTPPSMESMKQLAFTIEE